MEPTQTTPTSLPTVPASGRRRLVTPITQTVPAHRRPFGPAVAAHPHPRRVRRALAVWESFVIDVIGCVTTMWHQGTSIDPLDGEVLMVATSGCPTVELHFDVPITTPDPMHLRGAVHIIERMRPSIRREAQVSMRDLDRVTATELYEAVDRYPLVLARPGDASALERIRCRYDVGARPLSIAV